MFALEKHIKIWQLVGAVLAVPAGVAGTFSVYRAYVVGDVSCEQLRSSIIGVLDKNIDAETKRALLRKDVANFDTHCGAKDADAQVIFDAALELPATAQSATAQKRPAAGSGAIFGLSRGGEKRGWITILRRNSDGQLEPNFASGGEPMTARSAPEIGALMTARMMVPVWLEPPPAGQANNPSDLQGRIASGSCVRLVAHGPTGRPNWAEVEPASCSQAD